MAKRTEINPVSGERVKKLLQKNRITQEVLSERLGITVQHMSQIVTGNKRLTETNARKIAEMFPPVRMEYLMGWDDFETEDLLSLASVQKKAMDIRKPARDMEKRYDSIDGILEAMQFYLFATESIEKNSVGIERKKYCQFVDLLFEENRFIRDEFSEDTIQKLRDIYKNNHDRSYAEAEVFEQREIQKMREDPEAYLENEKILQKVYCELKSKIFGSSLVDKDGMEICQFTPEETENFINQLYDVVTALIQYHITKGKKKGQA